MAPAAMLSTLMQLRQGAGEMGGGGGGGGEAISILQTNLPPWRVCVSLRALQAGPSVCPSGREEQ